jgi:flagellar motor switch protein FliM
MDFGRKIGEYSGSRDAKFTRRKLAIGKRILEELAEKSKSKIVNLTERGEPLEGISYITVEQLTIAAARLQ